MFQGGTSDQQQKKKTQILRKFSIQKIYYLQEVLNPKNIEIGRQN